jgi:hypothetical protein
MLDEYMQRSFTVDRPFHGEPGKNRRNNKIPGQFLSEPDKNRIEYILL